MDSFRIVSHKDRGHRRSSYEADGRIILPTIVAYCCDGYRWGFVNVQQAHRHDEPSRYLPRHIDRGLPPFLRRQIICEVAGMSGSPVGGVWPGASNGRTAETVCGRRYD